MRRDRGFTVIEMVVALTILALILAMTITLYKTQGSQGRDTTKNLAVHEAVSMALLMIRQDILASGFGTADKPELSLFFEETTVSGKPVKRLYLNAGWVSDSGMDGELVTDTSDESKPNVWEDTAYIKGFSGMAYPMTGQTKLHPSEIGGLIVSSGSISGIPITACSEGSGDYSYTMASSVSGDAVPAIVYTFEEVDIAQKKTGLAASEPSRQGKRWSLTRNCARCSNPAVRARILGDVNFELTDFQVTADYWNESAIQQVTDFSDVQQVSNIRRVDVILSYRIASDAGWSNTFTKSIRVAPRTLTLAGY